jgi:hypothetical protein
LVGAPRSGDDVGTGFGEAESDGAADARSATDNYCRFAG